MKTQRALFTLIISVVMICGSALAMVNQSKREQTFSVGKNSSADVSVSGGDIVIKT